MSGSRTGPLGHLRHPGRDRGRFRGMVRRRLSEGSPSCRRTFRARSMISSIFVVPELQRRGLFGRYSGSHCATTFDLGGRTRAFRRDRAPLNDRNSAVIPGRRKAASPEAIFADRGYGFRAPCCARPRNDDLRMWRMTKSSRRRKLSTATTAWRCSAPWPSRRRRSGFLRRQDHRDRGRTRAGGGYDIYARALAKYWENYIPGHPTFMVRRHAGAGSARSLAYVSTTHEGRHGDRRAHAGRHSWGPFDDRPQTGSIRRQGRSISAPPTAACASASPWTDRRSRRSTTR